MAGLLNLMETELELTTPGYFADLCEAYEIKEERGIKFAEQQIKESWEQTRVLAWYYVQLQIDKKDRQPLKKFMPLPWDATDPVDVPKMRELAQSAKWVHANLDASEEPKTSSPEEVEESYKNLLTEWQQLQT